MTLNGIGFRTCNWYLSAILSLTLSIATDVSRLSFRYPSLLVDDIAEHEPGQRIVAIKNVTVNGEFCQGHFPGAPRMPGGLMIEAPGQVAPLLMRTGRRWPRGGDQVR